MTKGVRTHLTDGGRAALAADYAAGLGINALRAKYRIGQARVVATLDAAGVARLRSGMRGTGEEVATRPMQNDGPQSALPSQALTSH